MNNSALACILAIATLSATTFAAEPAKTAILPAPGLGKTVKYRPSDNGSDVKAFQCSLEDGPLTANFTDKPKQDNYVFIDFGRIDLAKLWPGGYVALDMEIDNPILKGVIAVADPENFWPTRTPLEGECQLAQGRHEYRFYLDTLTERRIKSGKDRFYLFLHDTGRDISESAKLTVNSITLHPQTANWQAEKAAAYKIQYAHPALRELGQIYRASYDRLVAWDSVRDNAFIKQSSLDGAWKKRYAGDLTWSYDALKDSSWAAPDFDDSSWGETNVPEPPVADQKGGHYLYRKKFNLDLASGEKLYLRMDDLADYAEIYINGVKASCQTSTIRRHDWLVEGGSRFTGNAGKPIKEMMLWRNFDRCNIPCPFNRDAVPDGELSLMMPIYSGVNPWPMATDLSGLAVNGENTIAIRLYGCPVKGFWIFRSNPDDRTYQNIFGILGSVKLLSDRSPAIADFKAAATGNASAAGTVSRRFECAVGSKFASEVARVVLMAEGMAPTEMSRGKDGLWSAMLSTNADFSTHSARAVAFGSDGKAIDERAISFPGSVIEVRGRSLFVNGDPYFIRGINSNGGVEFDNGRVVSKREMLRNMRTYRQLGFNTLRTNALSIDELQTAMQQGFMAMPVCAPASCDQSMLVLGNLENPDYEFSADTQKETAILFSSMPNLLFWNTGNEIHHTPGWSEKPIIDRFLETAQASAKRFDPSKRPTVFANLDLYGNSWFFTSGQDVIGLNTYHDNKLFSSELAEIAKESKRPYVFTEWGFLDNEAKAIKDRSANLDDWERRMAEKWALIKSSPASIGAFLYAYHGEMKDERGHAFLQKLMSPFEISVDPKGLKFKNNDVCAFRKLSLMLVSDADVPLAEYAKELKPGETLASSFSCAIKPGSYRLEIMYETHRGLVQEHAREIVVQAPAAAAAAAPAVQAAGN